MSLAWYQDIKIDGMSMELMARSIIRSNDIRVEPTSTLFVKVPDDAFAEFVNGEVSIWIVSSPIASM